MTQYDFGTMLGSDSGTQLATDLNAWRNALHTCHSGATQPAYRVAGTRWLDTTVSTLWVMKVYDGATWIGMYSVDPVNHIVQTTPARLRLPVSSTPVPTVSGVLAYDSLRHRLAMGSSGVTRYHSLALWEHITRATISAVSEVNFTNLSAYRMLRLRARLVPATMDSGFYARVSIDNGSSWIPDHYAYTSLISSTPVVVEGGSSNNANMYLSFGANTLLDANRGFSFTLMFYDFNQPREWFATLTGGNWAAPSTGTYHMGDAVYTMLVGNTTALNAFQVVNLGASMSGHYVLEGIRSPYLV